MNDGLKILAWTFGVFFGAATLLCIWEKHHPPGMPKYFVHCEVHADRDLSEAIYEQIDRERERNDPDGYERDKEQEKAEQRDLDTWGVTV